MKKTVSLFARNYDGDRLVRDELIPGAEWVVAGEGVATRKLDGTCCLVRDGNCSNATTPRPARHHLQASNPRKRLTRCLDTGQDGCLSATAPMVWHHPDGRMVKLKGKDFGITRGKLRQVQSVTAHSTT